MPKKKILIVNNSLEIGGVQTALINFLKFEKDNYDITLFLFYADEEQLKRVPASVRVIIGKGRIRALGVSQAKANAISKKLGLIRGACAFWAKKVNNEKPLMFLTSDKKRQNVSINEHYDIAASFLHGAGPHQLYGGCNEFVLNCVDADKKLSWVHCDYAHYEGNTEYNRNILRKFDGVVACSDSCAEVVRTVIPDIKGKVFSVHNFIDIDEIRKLAEAPNPYDTATKFNILTVARLSEEKGIIEAVTAFYDALNKGLFKNYSVKWNIVGDGPLRGEIEALIKEKGLQDRIVLWGAKSNPYPFFKYADALFVPSNHEAAPMIFGEASVFMLPIFTTRTTSAEELVEQQHRGVVSSKSQNKISLLIAIDKHFELLSQESSGTSSQYTMWDNEKCSKEFERLIRSTNR